MKLTQEQVEFFHREGWLFLPELFSQEEVDFLARGLNMSDIPVLKQGEKPTGSCEVP